jgi:7-carboxy-7-deazaguanine synthase
MQGEGIFAGAKTYFLRFAGCDCNCHWCFPKGHSVTMEDYSKKDISEVNIGDRIWGFNKSTGVLEVTTVTNVLTREEDIWEVAMEDKKLLTTKDHPILVTNKHNRRTWQNPQELAASADRWAFKVPYINSPEVTDQYMKGYLVAYFHGDGNFYQNKTMCSAKIISKVPESLEFLKECGKLIDVHFKDITHQGGINNIKLGGIQSNKKAEYATLISLEDSTEHCNEYYRGYLAGIFDAEGSYDFTTIKITQLRSVNLPTCVKIEEALQALGFEYATDGKGFRILGGFKESVRFFQHCDTKILHKRDRMYKQKYIQGDKTAKLIHVDSSRPKGFKTEVFNITTESHTYLLDDIIVHNCDETAHHETPEPVTVMEVLNSLNINECSTVTLTGGNPCIHDLTELVRALKVAGFAIHVETQGTVFPKWLESVDFLTLSPKGPSSGNPTDLFNLAQEVKNLRRVPKQFKPVVMVGEHGEISREDIEVLIQITRMFPKNYIVAQLGDDGTTALAYGDKYGKLIDYISNINELKDIRVLPQLHKLGNVK